MLRTILFILVSLFTFSGMAQAAKEDVIIKVNGDEMKGKVTEITDTEVKFTYKGETIVYTIKKVDILKITYSSGRVEMFNKQPLPSEAGTPSTPAAPAAQATPTDAGGDPRNKVAVLPFSYIKDGQPTVDELGVKVQTETAAYLTKHGGIYTIMDPRTSNALLFKAGVTPETFKGFTMDEICKILGVEYVLIGIVSVNQKGVVSNQNSNYNSKSSSNNKNSSNSSNKYSGSTTGTTTSTFETTLNVSVYNNKGTSVYSKERKSFWSTQDAYKSALESLLKQSPLYTSK